MSNHFPCSSQDIFWDRNYKEGEGVDMNVHYLWLNNVNSITSHYSKTFILQYRPFLGQYLALCMAKKWNPKIFETWFRDNNWSKRHIKCANFLVGFRGYRPIVARVVTTPTFLPEVTQNIKISTIHYGQKSYGREMAKKCPICPNMCKRPKFCP